MKLVFIVKWELKSENMGVGCIDGIIGELNIFIDYLKCGVFF